jgi:hypothetical protein
MNKVQNVSRLWLDKDSNTIVREWTDEEYQTLDPHTHIFEKYWTYYCPYCGFLPIPHGNKAEAEHGAKVHELHAPISRHHKCVVEYRKFELCCFETREEFLEDLGVWVHTQELY